MSITATKFQQRVGYYLGPAEKGEQINIQRLKPNKTTFKLYKTKNEDRKLENPAHVILKKLEKYMIDDGRESGLELQRRVRD